VWRQQLNTTRFRAVTALLFSPLVLRRAYARELVRAVPSRFDIVLRHRLERGFARHANRDNPYARLLLLGTPPLTAPTNSGSVDVVCADAADYLESASPESFDGFTLSNVFDGASGAYRSRLLRAVERAVAPVHCSCGGALPSPPRLETSNGLRAIAR
jgi:hypothetical protein